MDHNSGLPGRTVIVTVIISLFIFLLLSLFVVLSWGMGTTVNVDKGIVSLYLESDELLSVTPEKLKAMLCEKRFARLARDNKPPSLVEAGTGPTTYEIYRRAKPGDSTMVDRLIVAFSLSDCTKGEEK